MNNKNGVKYAKESIIDPFGRVFYYNGEIYRAIKAESKDYCLELLQTPLFRELTNLKYIPRTTIAQSITIEGIPLILHHERCIIIKPHEWTFEMFKSAAAFILEINEICNKYGYELKDSHPFNVTFHKGRPVYFDIGSIEKKRNGDWRAKREFIETNVLPLYLWSKGELCILRALIESGFECKRLSPNQGILEVKYFRDVLKEISVKIIARGHSEIRTNNKIILWGVRMLDYLVKIIKFKKNAQFTWRRNDYRIPTVQEIKGMKKSYDLTMRESYHGNLYDSELDKSFPRFEKIYKIVSKYCTNARTMLDLAGNQGCFSYYMYNKNIYDDITITDYDENALDKGYKFFANNDKSINVVWTNPMNPFDYEDTSKRLRADIVFALAVTHYLSLTKGFPFSVIMDKFNGFTNNYIVIEFMPLGIYDEGNGAPKVPSWYTIENFCDAFNNYFEILYKEQLELNRIVFVGKKKYLK